MSSIKPWVAPLRVTHDDYQNWLKQCPPREPLSFWALRMGHIPWPTYAAWAMEYYGLPVLDSSFFSQNTYPESLSKLPAHKPFGPHLLPLEQWEDITFVACAEPPAETPLSSQIRLILADPKELWKLWNNQTDSQKQEKSVSSGLLQLDNIDTSKFTAAPDGLSSSFNLEKSSPPDDFPSLNFDAPAGLQLEGTSTKISLQLEVPESSTVKTHAATTLHVPDHNFQQHFTELKQHFIAAWILRMDNNQLKPWKWDPVLKPMSDQATRSIDTTKPSLFRIVCRTKLPYHGHAVESPTNIEFFKAWGFAELPKHVTAVPILSGETLTGVMLAVGDSSANTPQVLLFAEKLAAGLNPNFTTSKAA